MAPAQGYPDDLRARLQAAEQRLRTAEFAGGIGTFDVDFDRKLWRLSDQASGLLAVPPQAQPRPFVDLSANIFVDDQTKILGALDAAEQSGTFYVEFRVRHDDGTIHWLAAKGQRTRRTDTPRRELSGALHDISERKTLEARLLATNESLEARLAELRDESRTLALLHETGMKVAAELDLERLVQAVTDAGVELSGAAFGAFFYNLISDTDESYTLYTLSGAPRERFEGFPMPRNTAVFEPTFRGTGIVRSHDILADPRYGKSAPHHGMPKGHLPVRSYLAVPVVSRSGEVLGGLFFGHSQPGMFTERAERIVAALAAQAAVAIDNARLYQTAQHELSARTRAEEELRALNRNLERRAAERGRELAARSALLEDTERRFRLLVEGVRDYAIFMLDPTGHIVNWNPGAERIKGYRRDEIVGRHFSTFYTEPDRAKQVPARALETAVRTGKFEAEGWRVRKDGTTFWANVVINAIRDGDGSLIGFAKVTRDLTERRANEEQLRQSQKMEGVGQLTGGVAHDFNNLLTVIIGNLDALQRHLRDSPTDPIRLRHAADNAMRGARRAEGLTQRLLAFSRQQPLDPKPVDVGRLISGMSDLLRRTLGEHVAIETALAGGLWLAHIDPNQLEVAIINLAVNARDAMPDGGRLTIETANVLLDEVYAAGQVEVLPGQYVLVAVSDTGIGMTPEVVTKAFDPFFTTKEIGHGTGLGLSQVYGFAKQSRGHVKIYSELGQGTTVKLYLPRWHAQAGATADKEEEAPQLARGSANETILLVEDDADVRRYSCDALRELGYRVLEAETGAAALQLLDHHPEINLLFTDVGLPGGMNGRQLADAARARRGDLKILFTSGYARNAIVHGGRLDPGVELLVKPFTQAALATRLRNILDAGAGPQRILVVEDEFLIQMLATQYLEESGLKVEVAGSATEALNKLGLVPGGFDAVVLDLGLPDQTGDDLLREIRARYPSLPVVVASGRGQPELPEGESRHLAFVPKPYDAGTLRTALRRVGVAC